MTGGCTLEATNAAETDAGRPAAARAAPREVRLRSARAAPHVGGDEPPQGRPPPPRTGRAREEGRLEDE